MAQSTKNRILLVAAALLALSISGCQVLTWAFVAFTPKPKIPALYRFDRDLRVLVFPDSPHGDLEFPTIRDQLADKLNRELIRHKLVADTVPFDALRVQQEQMDREYRRAEGRPAPLNALAAKVGADAVLYVDIRRFRLRSASGEPVWSGQFNVMVRVVDAAGQRLWPPSDRAEGYPVSLELTPTTNDSSTYALTLTETMAERMAERIAQLFYKHRPES